MTASSICQLALLGVILLSYTMGYTNAKQCLDADKTCCDSRPDCAKKIKAFNGICYNPKFFSDPGYPKPLGGDCCFSCVNNQPHETGTGCEFGNKKRKFCTGKTVADCDNNKVRNLCCDTCWNAERPELP